MSPYVPQFYPSMQATSYKVAGYAASRALPTAKGEAGGTASWCLRWPKCRYLCLRDLAGVFAMARVEITAAIAKDPLLQFFQPCKW